LFIFHAKIASGHVVYSYNFLSFTGYFSTKWHAETLIAKKEDRDRKTKRNSHNSKKGLWLQKEECIPAFSFSIREAKPFPAVPSRFFIYRLFTMDCPLGQTAPEKSNIFLYNRNYVFA